jgi:hypothetical protein
MRIWPKLFPTVKRALDPDTGKPIPYPRKQWLQGKLTPVCLALTAIGSLGKIAGLDLPVEQVQGILTWVAAHWDELAQVVGLFGSAYAQLRRNWRHD